MKGSFCASHEEPWPVRRLYDTLRWESLADGRRRFALWRVTRLPPPSIVALSSLEDALKCSYVVCGNDPFITNSNQSVTGVTLGCASSLRYALIGRPTRLTGEPIAIRTLVPNRR